MIKIGNKSLSDLNFQKIFQKLLLIIPLGVLGNIIFSYLSTDQEIMDKLTDFSPGYFLLAVIMAFVPWFTHSLRIHVWIKFINKKVNFKNLLKIVIGTDLGAAFTPTAIGGGYIKIGMLMNYGLSTGRALSINTLGSIEDASFFIIALPTAFILSNSWNLPIIQDLLSQLNFTFLIKIFSGILILPGLIYFLFRINHSLLHKFRKHQIFKWFKKFKIKLVRVWKEFLEVYKLIGRRGKLLFVLNLFLAAIQWTLRYSVITVLLLSLNIHVNIIQFFILQWVVFSLLNLVPSPGAMGGAEAAFYFIYKTLVPTNIIGIATAGWRFLTFYMILGVAVIIFYFLNYKNIGSFKNTISTVMES